MSTLNAHLLAYLLNSLWQVPVLFAAAWVAARAARRNGPATEHRIWVTALILETLLPACSISPILILHFLAQLLPWSWNSNTANANAHVTVTTGAAYTHGLIHLPTQLLTFALLAYACTLPYFAARLLWGLHKTARLHRHAQRIDLTLTGSAAHTWTRCCNHFSVHDAQLAASPDVTFPMTVGIRHRLVLLPAILPSSLQAEDLDAAIAHEFAHMHRRDFASNLAYALLSLPIAYHPLAWLTRARIEETREMICDAMAAVALAGSHRYARSLLRLASLLAHSAPNPTLHAIGIFDANIATIFERRIMNLTQPRIQPPIARRLATASACIVLGLATCASALALRMNVATPSLSNQSQQPSNSATAIHVASGVVAGNRLNFIQPVYPPQAKERKISGSVLLHAIIGKDGTMEHLDVISGPKELLKSSLDAVKQWTYKPYLLNGEPVAVDTTITVNYSLQN